MITEKESIQLSLPKGVYHIEMIRQYISFVLNREVALDEVNEYLNRKSEC